jgi:hypothetical protein
MQLGNQVYISQFSLFLTFHSFLLLTHLYSKKLISDTCFLPPSHFTYFLTVAIFHHNLPLFLETWNLCNPDEIGYSLCTKYFPTKYSLADTCYSLSPVILIVLYSTRTFLIDGTWVSNFTTLSYILYR